MEHAASPSRVWWVEMGHQAGKVDLETLQNSIETPYKSQRKQKMLGGKAEASGVSQIPKAIHQHSLVLIISDKRE